MLARMRRLLFALVVSQALACGQTDTGETIPPDLLVDETVPADQRKKPEKAAETAPEPTPQPAEVATPDDVAAPPANAKKTAKGVFYVVLRAGTGKVKPKAQSTVKVHYSGWTTDGRLFDSSVRRGEPAEFPVGALIPGWVDVLQQMVAGDKWRVWIPEDLAYKGREGAPQGMLVFEMELLEIVSL